MRAVIDTNVLISAIFWPGKPKQLLNKVRRGEIVFLTSQALLAELKEVLIREGKPFQLAEEEAQRVLSGIRELAEIIRPHSLVTRCQDEADNRVLECAIDGRAEYIITGDTHLLELKSFEGIQLTTVADFLVAVTS